MENRDSSLVLRLLETKCQRSIKVDEEGNDQVSVESVLIQTAISTLVRFQLQILIVYDKYVNIQLLVITDIP